MEEVTFNSIQLQRTLELIETIRCKKVILYRPKILEYRGKSGAVDISHSWYLCRIKTRSTSLPFLLFPLSSLPCVYELENELVAISTSGTADYISRRSIRRKQAEKDELNGWVNATKGWGQKGVDTMEKDIKQRRLLRVRKNNNTWKGWKKLELDLDQKQRNLNGKIKWQVDVSGTVKQAKCK